jgi:hypothetical protein
MAGHQGREAAAQQARRESARGVEVRGGRERRARCGEVEAGVPFIGSGRRGGGWVREGDGRWPLYSVEASMRRL